MRGVAATILLLRGCVVRCFEEYLEMGTPWMARAGAPDAACAAAAPRPLPKSLRKRLAFFAFVATLLTVEIRAASHHTRQCSSPPRHRFRTPRRPPPPRRRARANRR